MQQLTEQYSSITYNSSKQLKVNLQLLKLSQANLNLKHREHSLKMLSNVQLSQASQVNPLPLQERRSPSWLRKWLETCQSGSGFSGFPNACRS